ncbi:hypothetical protein PRVXT_001760 [Proteinivorax tanatarense]|uniref:LytR family transcriptional regulator n=1 Tax=Proteinivorax tanatarense TaxID=1260629 RepID=A0AAU7VI53_9FIRM
MKFSKRNRFKKGKSGVWKKIVSIIALVVAVGFIAYTYRTVGLISALQGTEGYWDVEGNDQEAYLIVYTDKENEQNPLKSAFVVVLGSEGPAYNINIPTQTTVDFDAQRITLNDVYRGGTIDDVVTAVEQTFYDGFIDNYVILDSEGVKTLVENGREFEIHIRQNFDHEDFTRTTGERTLETDEVMAYMEPVENHLEGNKEFEPNERFIQRQIDVVLGIFDNNFKWNRALGLIGSFAELENRMYTNMDIRQLALFRNMLDESLERERHTFTLPGETVTIDGNVLWVPNQNEIANNTIIAIQEGEPYVPRYSIAYAVVNGTNITGLAGSIRDEIQNEFGFSFEVERKDGQDSVGAYNPSQYHNFYDGPNFRNYSGADRTQIYVHPDYRVFAEGILEYLKDHYPANPRLQLNEDMESHDVVIILGYDLKED